MRYQDWPTRLHTLIAERQHTPFKWGGNDCCLFAADAVLALTGADPAADIRGNYAADREALQILKGRGGVRGIATAALGPEIPPLMAQRGDIVMFDGEHGDSLAVCVGARCAAPGDAGLVFMEMTQATAAWRVQ